MDTSQANVVKDNSDTLKVYQELCISYRAIDDFRAKLLGFLPLASVGGAFLLLNEAFTGSDCAKIALAKQLAAPLGYFGFIITLGLFCYEIYGIRKCHDLIVAGRNIEGDLNIIHGQFTQRARNVLYVINEPFAAGVIYPAVMAGWMFLARVFPQTDKTPAIEEATNYAVEIFVIGFVVTLVYNIVLPHERKIRDWLIAKKILKPKDRKQQSTRRGVDMNAPEDREGAISRFREGPNLLEQAVIGLRDAELDARPSGGGWSVREIVHHIADGDDIWKMYIKMAIGNEQAEFDLGWYASLPQVTWGDRWAYSRRSIGASLSLLRAGRDHVLQLLASVPEAWNRSIAVRTPKAGIEQVPVGFVIQMQADHVMHHLERIRAILREGGAA